MTDTVSEHNFATFPKTKQNRRCKNFLITVQVLEIKMAGQLKEIPSGHTCQEKKTASDWTKTNLDLTIYIFFSL